MSKAEILEQLPHLKRGDRREIMDRIWAMEEADLLAGSQPDPGEKDLLDREFEDFQANPKAGAEWKEVESRLRRELRP